MGGRPDILSVRRDAQLALRTNRGLGRGKLGIRPSSSLRINGNAQFVDQTMVIRRRDLRDNREYMEGPQYIPTRGVGFVRILGSVRSEVKNLLAPPTKK